MNKYNLMLLLLIVTLFSITLGSAAIYEQGENANVIFKYSEFPSCASFECNVTIFRPDTAVLINNDPTEANIGFSNYTLNSTQTSLNGFYEFVLVSSNGTSYDGTFQITPNGEVPTEANAIFYIGLLIVLIFGLILIVYFGVSSENLIVKTSSLGFGYLFLMAISFVAWNMAADFLTSSPFLVTFIYWIFIVLMIGFFPFLLILFAYGVYMMLTLKEIRDMIDRGIPESEAAERSKWKK